MNILVEQISSITRKDEASQMNTRERSSPGNHSLLYKNCDTFCCLNCKQDDAFLFNVSTYV